MGLGLLFTGIAALISGIECAKENHEAMKTPYSYMEDGTPLYRDRLCNKYINGEKVIPRFNCQTKTWQEVGSITGKIYFDSDVAEENRKAKMNARIKAKAIANGELAYMKHTSDFHGREVTCEISTDRYIAALKGKKVGNEFKYYKYYALPDEWLCTEYNENEGIEISREEFDKLNIFMGSHFCIDPLKYYSK